MQHASAAVSVSSSHAHLVVPEEQLRSSLCDTMAPSPSLSVCPQVNGYPTIMAFGRGAVSGAKQGVELDVKSNDYPAINAMSIAATILELNQASAVMRMPAQHSCEYELTSFATYREICSDPAHVCVPMRLVVVCCESTMQG